MSLLCTLGHKSGLSYKEEYQGDVAEAYTFKSYKYEFISLCGHLLVTLYKLNILPKPVIPHL